MGQTENLTEKSEEFSVDVGEGDIFLGKKFDRPYFMDTRVWKMMKPWSPEYIHIKTWKGEIYQFRLTEFHNNQAMLITSTLKDTFTVINIRDGFGIKKTMNYARRAKRTQHPVKGSFTGYWTWGHYFEDQYARLMHNLKLQRIYFSDDALKDIFDELKRRQNEKNRKRSGTRRSR